jgi:hypothetical protein
MERRTFLTSLTGATALTVVPWSLSAKPRAHTNYYAQSFDKITKLVPDYAMSSRWTSHQLDVAARKIIALGPTPATKRDTLQLRWRQVDDFYQLAFGVKPTPVTIGRTVHALTHYGPPQTTLYRANGSAWAQELGTDPGAVNFAAGMVNDGLASYSAALCIAISAEAAGVAFEGASITLDEVGAALAGLGEGGVAALGAAISGLGVALAGLTLAALGIGLIALALACQNDDGSPGNVASCTTCDCTSSSACGVGPGDSGAPGDGT